MDINEFCEKYKQADMVLIGIGSELHRKQLHDDDIAILREFASKLERKNYFVITSNADNLIEELGLNPKRIAQPMLIAKDKEDVKEREEKQWELYNKWLSATLNKNLLLIEIGEGFQNPSLFRWPFEKVTLINQKAFLYRIHSVFAQLPEEITRRAESINANGIQFLKELKNNTTL